MTTKLVTLSILLGSLAALAACGEDTKSRRRGFGAAQDTGPGTDDANPNKPSVPDTVTPPVTEPEPADTPPDSVPDDTLPSAKDEVVGVGLRNYDQIDATMSVLTGVAPTTAAVKAERDKLTTSLPTENDVQGFLGTQQVSVFKLAVEYCDALTLDAAKRTAFFGDAVNFAATPAVNFTAAGKAKLATVLIQKLWGTGLDSLPPESESTAMVVKLTDDVLVGKTMTDVPTTRNVVTGVCTAVLSSASVSLY